MTRYPHRQPGGLSGGLPAAMFRRMSGSIEVLVNGEARALPQGTTVSALLGTIGLDARKVAVERNQEIVPRSAYAITRLAAGDALEIVHFIGGG